MRKVVEGVLGGCAGSVVSSHLDKKHNTRSSGSASRDQHPTGGVDPVITEIVEGVLATAGGVGLAHHEKSKRSHQSGSALSDKAGDPRVKALMEGAIATVGAVAVAHHEKKNPPKRAGHRRSRRHTYERD